MLRLISLLLWLLLSSSAQGGELLSRELPAGLQVPADARPGPGFDVDRATEAYLALLTPEQTALSEAYFEGGYWLELWTFLYGAAVCLALLASGASARLRDWAARHSRRLWLQTAFYAAAFIVLYALLVLPLSLYQDFFREHAYGLATQTLGEWFGDALKGLLVNVLLGSIAIAGIYTLVRRSKGRWWIKATVFTSAFLVVVLMIAPVFIAPLFNDYEPLPPGEIRDSMLSLARGNGVPADDVYWFDASRQTTRISANVSGFGRTTRISLNDNLLEKTSVPEIRAVMGHEIGHYVLNHSLELVIYLGLLFSAGFWFVNVAMDGLVARIGSRWGLRQRADPATLPLALLLFSTFLFVTTPVSNSIIRQTETEADIYGLNAAREPHGFAMAAMRLSAYRKIKPGRWEEILFYDHPSGYARVRMSMQWLAENQRLYAGQAAAAAAAPAARQPRRASLRP